MPKRSSQHRRRQITKGHRARVFGSTSRRLRLEGMEGRLMLSTTAEVDFPPLNLTVAQFNFDSMAPTPGGEVSIYNAAGNSGGFIETPYSSGPPLSVPGKRYTVAIYSAGDRTAHRCLDSDDSACDRLGYSPAADAWLRLSWIARNMAVPR